MSLIKSKGYSVTIGETVFAAITTFLKQEKYTSYYIVCDENTLRHCLPNLVTNCALLQSAAIIELEVGETSKSVDFCAHIWQTLLENGADKKTLMINLGGGVVSDLGGFTASVYKRGIDFINIPTSLLAMADASVGGKTGINFNALKNVIGTISQPKAVFIHPGFLNTLPARQYKNGLAEIYKIALVSDKKLWMQLKTGIKKESIEATVTKSVSLKNKIVLKDPYEKGLRKILNFGHSIGHAVESIFLEDLLHGECIAIGMIMETHISFQKKLISKPQLNEIVETLISVFKPTSIHKRLDVAGILKLLKNDKKTLKNKYLFALINDIGSCQYDVEISEPQIKKSFDYYTSLL